MNDEQRTSFMTGMLETIDYIRERSVGLTPTEITLMFQTQLNCIKEEVKSPEYAQNIFYTFGSIVSFKRYLYSQRTRL